MAQFQFRNVLTKEIVIKTLENKYIYLVTTSSYGVGLYASAESQHNRESFHTIECVFAGRDGLALAKNHAITVVKGNGLYDHDDVFEWRGGSECGAPFSFIPYLKHPRNQKPGLVEQLVGYASKDGIRSAMIWKICVLKETVDSHHKQQK